MSKNVFRANNNYNPKVKRNSVDLTFANNFTTKIGCITPVMRAFLNAGESLRFDCQHALQFLPTAFTVQSPVRVSVHHFAVRVRNLYKDFEDWRYKNKPDLKLPMLRNPSADMWGTGKLMDYLGAETTTYLTDKIDIEFLLSHATRYVQDRFAIAVDDNPTIEQTEARVSEWLSRIRSINSYSALIAYFGNGQVVTSSDNGSFSKNTLVVSEPQHLPADFKSLSFYTFDSGYSSDAPIYPGVIFFLRGSEIGSTDDSITMLKATSDITDIQSYIEYLNRPNYRDGMSFAEFWADQLYFSTFVVSNRSVASSAVVLAYGYDPVSTEICRDSRFPDYLTSSGFNALYPRAYESIYNFFYRSNQQVDPFTINGVVEPNKYTFTTDGGDDWNEYLLHFRNYEDDMFTTAKTTPIQGGKVPLVGITSNGLNSVLHFQRPDGSIAEIRSTLDDDGNVATINNEDLAKESQQVRLSAIEQVSQGVSIYDIRDASALTRWLEKNIRKGLRFADQQSAHTGVTPSFQELDMPEFIGGYSRVVSVGKVNDTANELGTYVGQLSSFSGSNHSVSYYADEPTIIMSVLCVIPQPVYSQVQDKFLTKLDALDFFDPDFNRLSMQPITYREITPWEKYISDGNLDDVFGYQIPWYEDISCVDEAHGQMRTTFNSFLFTRNFSHYPKLGRNFLRINPDEMNKVFIYEQPDEDPIKGQIVFTRFKKTQVSKLNLPAIM